jgi:predicted RNA-binding protein YlxR (DUF448 family)
VRFAAVSERLTAGRSLPGRGVYTCRDLGCFEQAEGRRAFGRVLRCNVAVDPELRRIYTDADG